MFCIAVTYQLYWLFGWLVSTVYYSIWSIVYLTRSTRIYWVVGRTITNPCEDGQITTYKLGFVAQITNNSSGWTAIQFILFHSNQIINQKIFAFDMGWAFSGTLLAIHFQLRCTLIYLTWRNKFVHMIRCNKIQL